jgi:hypothetical protein
MRTHQWVPFKPQVVGRVLEGFDWILLEELTRPLAKSHIGAEYFQS